MASKLEDREMNLMKCGLCSEQLQEPKRLPCLCRFCYACLGKYVTDNRKPSEATFTCPVCHDSSELTPLEIDGIDDDEFAESVLSKMKILEECRSKSKRRCDSCKDFSIIVAYCLKCALVCDKCANIHKTMWALKEHKIIPVETVTSQTFLDHAPPNCKDHTNQPAPICCNTCSGQLICSTCSQLKHRFHELADMKDAANLLREKLNEKSAEMHYVDVTLQDHKADLRQRQKQLFLQAEDSKKAALAKCAEDKKISDTKSKNKTEELKTRYNNEIQDSRAEIRRIMDKIATFEHQRDTKITQVKKSNEKYHQDANQECKTTVTNIETKKHEVTQGFEDGVQMMDSLLKRCTNNIETASLAIAGTTDPTALQFLPHLCETIELQANAMLTFHEEHKHEIDQFNDAFAASLNDLDVMVPESEFNVDKWVKKVSSISGMKPGQFVLAGEDANGHLIVLSITTDNPHQPNVIGKANTPSGPNQSLCVTDSSTVAVTYFGQILMCTVGTNHSFTVNIGHRIQDPCSSQAISADPNAKGKIFVLVGEKIKKYDQGLNFCGDIPVPPSGIPTIIAVNKNNLICLVAKQPISIDFNGAQNGVFTPPGNTQDVDAKSICCDSQGCVYILWQWPQTGDKAQIVAKYLETGKLLWPNFIRWAKLKVDPEVTCITIIRGRNGQEKLLGVARGKKFLIYNIKDMD